MQITKRVLLTCPVPITLTIASATKLVDALMKAPHSEPVMEIACMTIDGICQAIAGPATADLPVEILADLDQASSADRSRVISRRMVCRLLDEMQRLLPETDDSAKRLAQWWAYFKQTDNILELQNMDLPMGAQDVFRDPQTDQKIKSLAARLVARESDPP